MGNPFSLVLQVLFTLKGMVTLHLLCSRALVIIKYIQRGSGELVHAWTINSA